MDRAAGQYPLIDAGACIGCGSCVAACREGDVLGIVMGKAVVINGDSADRLVVSARATAPPEAATAPPAVELARDPGRAARAGALAVAVGEAARKAAPPEAQERRRAPHPDRGARLDEQADEQQGGQPDRQPYLHLELRIDSKAVPPDRLLTETDAPFLKPRGVRGSRNQPLNVAVTATWLCGLRGDDPRSFGDALVETFDRFVGASRSS